MLVGKGGTCSSVVLCFSDGHLVHCSSVFLGEEGVGGFLETISSS